MTPKFQLWGEDERVDLSKFRRKSLAVEVWELGSTMRISD